MDTVFLENVQKIVIEEILAGNYLTEQKLALRLGVSRTPIRDALTLLETQGILERKRYHGIKLRPVPLKDFIETYDLRIALEGMAARILAVRIDRETLEKLTVLAESSDRVTESEQAASTYENRRVDLDFHQTLIDKCGNVRLKKFLDTFRLISSSFHSITKIPNGAPARKIRFTHTGIVTALSSREPDKAELAMRLHIQEGRERLIQDVLEFAYPSAGEAGINLNEIKKADIQEA